MPVKHGHKKGRTKWGEVNGRSRSTERVELIRTLKN